MKEIIKKVIGKIKVIRYNISKYGKGIYIGKGNKIIGGKNINIENNVSIRPYGFIACNENAKLSIGENTDIGNRVRICVANKIEIGKNVLFGPNVFIADQDHEYRNPDIAIMYQGVKIHEKGIEIGDDSWIGINSVIVGSIRIGKHCVIGANSIVNKNIPDYSVAVGSPAKVIKRYNFEKKEWEHIK